MASKKTNKQTSTSAIAQDINNNNVVNTTKNNQRTSTTTDAPPNGPMRRSKRAVNYLSFVVFELFCFRLRVLSFQFTEFIVF